MTLQKFAFLLFLFDIFPCHLLFDNDPTESSLLTPYIDKHGSRLSHHEIRDACHEIHQGSFPHEVYPSHTTNRSLPFVQLTHFVKEFRGRIIRGHFVVVSNPIKTISILEPKEQGGCHNAMTETVLETAKQKNCVIAMNAGYFNTTSRTCLGNVISDGRLAFDSGGIQNAHFGLKKDGTIFTGYISEEEVLKEPSDFEQLVGGVVWLLRNNSGYVEISKDLECEKSQETGSMDFFVNIVSARTAIGHDDKGRVILVHVDGKSFIDGISLLDFQLFLQEHGLRNAINLDGGGSSTFVLNGSVANYPSDQCLDKVFNCGRKVSTVLCVHPPDCEPENCSGHGNCVDGQCICHDNWLPPCCGQLVCSLANCSGNGVCTESGCLCDIGFYGKNCSKLCSSEWSETKCRSFLSCQNGGVPNFTSGICNCLHGFNGSYCERVCPFGYFGQNCSKLCRCNSSLCFCNPVDGSCVTRFDKNFNMYDVGSCMVEAMFKKASNEGLIPLTLEQIENTKSQCYAVRNQINTWYHTVIVLSVITAISVAINFLVIIPACFSYLKNSTCFRRMKNKYHYLDSLTVDRNSFESSDNEDI